MKQKDVAIVLQKRSYSETSFILTLFLKRAGRQTFIFKGARKKSTVLFAPGVYEITYFHRPETEMGIISSMDALFPLQQLLADPQRIIIGFFMADVLQQTLKIQEGDVPLFDFVTDAVNELETTNDLFLFPLRFLAKLTELLGYVPSNEVENAHYFHLDKGVFSNEPTYSLQQISGEEVAVLQALYEGKECAHFSRESIRSALKILLFYLRTHAPGFHVEKTLDIIQATLHD